MVTELIDAETAVRTLLDYIGEDPDRPGLIDTPERVVRMLREMTNGNAHVDVADILARQFPERCDELILVTGIPFASLCEHHLLPFTGTVAVGYIPRNDQVVGLSKLARLVEVCSRRLQVQERLTAMIADALAAQVDTVGVGVVVRGTHSCMALRGVRAPGTMTTSAMLGALRDKPEARNEFLTLALGARP